VVIPLVNWSGKPVPDLQVTLRIKPPAGKITLAGGGPVKVSQVLGQTVLTFGLDVADALILR
jgi:hypothetical protein